MFIVSIYLCSPRSLNNPRKSLQSQTKPLVTLAEFSQKYPKSAKIIYKSPLPPKTMLNVFILVIVWGILATLNGEDYPRQI